MNRRGSNMKRTYLAAAFVVALVGCKEEDFDGLYRVDSYSLNEMSCAEAGPEIEREFPKFRVTGRDWLGVTIYPVYPCDENGVCDEDNDGRWNLVTEEDDLDAVSSTTAFNVGTTCVLQSTDLVIDKVGEKVILQQRTNEAVIAPYDASTCTTDTAKDLQDDMQCARLLQLVGVPADAAEM